MKKQEHPLDLLIQNFKADTKLLDDKEIQLNKIKLEKSEIQGKLKTHSKDLSVLIRYASEEQIKQIEELGLDTSPSTGKGALNPISQIALDTLTEAKGNKLTNGKLFDAYIDSLDKDAEAESYSLFNVKIRQLYSQGRIEKKQLDSNKPSRDDIISLVKLTTDN